MKIPKDLFETDESSTEPNAPTRWLLVTNQRNLLYMLAAGLVMPPKGFGKKDKELFRQIYRRSSQVSIWAGTLISVTLIALGPEIVEIWTEGKF